MKTIKSVLMDSLGATEKQAEGLSSWVFDDFKDEDADKLESFLRETYARLYDTYEAYEENEDPEDREYTSVMNDASYGVIVWNI